MYRFTFLATFMAAALLGLRIAAAAQLHYPLPPDSTEQNGVPQHKTAHRCHARTEVCGCAATRSRVASERCAGSDAALFRHADSTLSDTTTTTTRRAGTKAKTDLTPATVGFGQLRSAHHAERRRQCDRAATWDSLRLPDAQRPRHTMC